MNKLYPVILLFIVITISVIVITNEQASYKPEHNVALNIVSSNNTIFISYPSYTIEEKMINGSNYIFFVNNPILSNQPAVLSGQVPQNSNFTLVLNFTGNANFTCKPDANPYKYMIAYISGYTGSGQHSLNGCILLNLNTSNIIGRGCYALSSQLSSYIEAYAQINITFTNQYYNIWKPYGAYGETPLNKSIAYQPNAIYYNSNTTLYTYNATYNNYITYYSISYYVSQFDTSSPVYANYFTANNLTFSLYINGETFKDVSSALVELPNGIYPYNYTIGNYTGNGFLTVNGKSVNIILAQHFYTNNYVLYLYLIIVFVSLILISKYTKGFIISYSLSGLLFLFIGYKENIEFFTPNLVILIITFLAILFTYKVVMTE